MERKCRIKFMETEAVAIPLSLLSRKTICCMVQPKVHCISKILKSCSSSTVQSPHLNQQWRPELLSNSLDEEGGREVEGTETNQDRSSVAGLLRFLLPVKRSVETCSQQGGRLGIQDPPPLALGK